MKERQKRELMSGLLLDNNTYIMVEKDIMEELVRFYATLFAKDPLLVE